MQFHHFILLSLFSVLSLQSPVLQTTTVISCSTNLPTSAPTTGTPTMIKLFGDETQGDSAASAFSSNLTSAITHPFEYTKTHLLILVGTIVILGGFIVLLIWGYKKRKAKMEAEQAGYDDEGYGGGQQGSNNTYGGGQGQAGQGYVGSQTQGYAQNNNGGGRVARGEEKRVDEKEDEDEESEEGED